MSDERLEAGRHHLRNGNRAVQQGYPNEARAFFESALLQFRGPELRVGEAHALRGLAQVALATGAVDAAERHARAAIDSYQDLCALLDGVADPQAVAELRTDALQGDAAARVVLAEILTRTGRRAAARATLDEARDLLDQQRHSTTAGAVWTAIGRLALRTGDEPEARRWFERALETHRKADDPEGEIAVLLLMAEQERRSDALDRAAELLGQARAAAQQLDHDRWEGRLLTALGAVAEQAGRPAEALSYYQDAVSRTRESGEIERHAVALIGLGAAQAQLGDPQATDHMLEGLRALAALDNPAAVASGLQRLGGQARRQGRAALALGACEGARRLWAVLDDPRGQILALRHIVKALSGLRAGRGALVAAVVRERMVGEGPSSAHEVAAWFRERAPAELLSEIDAMSLPDLRVDLRREIERALARALDDPNFSPDDLAVPDLAVAVVERLVAASPPVEHGGAKVAVHLVAPTETHGDETPPEPAEREALGLPAAAAAVAPAEPAEEPEGAGPPPARPERPAEDLYASLFGGED